MSPEEAAMKGLLSADEYLDLYGEPRRPWPPVKDNKGEYCVLCQRFFEKHAIYRGHMKAIHLVVVPSPLAQQHDGGDHE